MLEVLNKYLDEGLVMKQVHPTLPLTIWNYTPKTQYGELYDQYKLWDEITLQCRGLVTDDKGNVVARPFKKFFNMEEKQYVSTPDFDVYEKMDGSLGILFYYERELTDFEMYKIWFNNNYETGMENNFDPNNLPNFDDPYYEPTPKTKGEWILATRGSFTSDQSIKGFELLKKYDYEKLHPEYTYLFEIIYPENRIVCQYDFEDLVLLGMIHTETGTEVDIHEGNENDIRFKNMLNNIGFNIVRKYDGITDYTYLKEMIADTHEGFVIKFSNGDRMKVKGTEYLRLHKIMTNVSTTSVWEVLSTGGDMSVLLDNVPDEFYKKIKEYVRDLKYSHYQITERCGKLHDHFRYGKYGDVDPEPSKKEFAEYVKKYVNPKLWSVMFAMWDRKDYDRIVWNLLKPEFKKL